MNAIVLCVRVKDQATPVFGSVTERCQGGCEQDVWISKATSESVGAAPPWCIQCATDALPPGQATPGGAVNGATSVEGALRADIRRALDDMDEALFNSLAAWAGLNGYGETFERVSREQLEASQHNVKTFWEGPCNCCGVLN